jgi:hypothetical protein
LAENLPITTRLKKGEGQMCDVHGEPKLSDLLGDPILRLLLDRDGVSVEDLRELIQRARRQCEGAAEGPPLH